MQQKKVYVTNEGLENIKHELEQLKKIKRKEISERIQEAKELGDLSENAEYIEAKEEQAFVETRILNLEQMLKNCEVITLSKSSSKIQIGTTFTARDENNKECTYTIVGSSEVDPLNNRISNESPLGCVFLGKKAGELVIADTPKGQKKFTIISIQ